MGYFFSPRNGREDHVWKDSGSRLTGRPIQSLPRHFGEGSGRRKRRKLGWKTPRPSGTLERAWNEDGEGSML